MRTSHVAVLVIALLVVACGGAASPSPSPSPRPSPSPNLHLDDPADVGVIYTALQKAGLKMTVHNASEASKEGEEPRRRYALDLGGWPLELIEYGSADARSKDYAYEPGVAPGEGHPPYTLAGLNIVVTFGPERRREIPEVPDQRFQDLANTLGKTLDVYLGPLDQRAVTDLAIPDPAPRPSAEPGAASGKPDASAKPTAKPSAKPS
jgi:hypothetical protein